MQPDTREWPKAPFCSLAGPLRLLSTSLPEGNGWLVQSWLPLSNSCRERERGIPKMHCSEQAFLVTVASLTDWLAVNIRWGLDSITMAVWIIKSSYSIISLFLWGGKRVWNTRPIKTFPVSDVSITDLAPKVKCFGLQNVHYMGVFL